MSTKAEVATPFVLLWAKRAPVEILKSRDSIFSDDVGGLVQPGMFERWETTGANPESADTTFGIGH
jgi:hypothetical protein